MTQYRLGDLWTLARTPIGRRTASYAALGRAWPLLRGLAAAYRSTVVRRCRIVTVVGSFGKTTTTRVVLAGLGLPLDRSLRGNAYNRLVQATFAIRPSDQYAAIEVGIDGPGQMAGYARLLRPDIVVVTSIGSEHGRSLGSLEATRHEKAEMVRALPADGLAVLNGDDPHVRWMAGETRARVVTCGFDPGNDLRASDVTLDWPRGTIFTLHQAGQTRRVGVRLLGQQQIFSVLAAIAIVQAEDLDLDQALTSLAELPPTPGRLEAVPLPSGALVLRDDFKGALETYHSAIDLLADLPARRRLAVVGDVSELTASQRPTYRELGRRLASCCNELIVVGGNHQPYRAGAARAGLPHSAVAKANRSVVWAAALAASLLEPGDVILVKGKDRQRLERVVLALLGRTVRCDIPVCNVILSTRCEVCPMLERGWDGLDERSNPLARRS